MWPNRRNRPCVFQTHRIERKGADEECGKWSVSWGDVMWSWATVMKPGPRVEVQGRDHAMSDGSSSGFAFACVFYFCVCLGCVLAESLSFLFPIGLCARLH